MNAFTTQVNHETQERFYDCWLAFDETSALSEVNSVESPVEADQKFVQKPVEPIPQAEWVYIKLLQRGGETLVKVLSEKSNSITVHVPGAGIKTILHSDAIRVATASAMDWRSQELPLLRCF